MIKRNSLTILLLFFLSYLFAQSGITISGKIIDDKTEEGIPYAYVKLIGYTIGTVSDGDGFFKLQIPNEHSQKDITFSYLGYKDYSVPVLELEKNKSIVIKLKTIPSELKEIVVKAEKLPSAKAILKKAINKIPENYAENPVFLNSYYRETLSENDGTIKYSDAVCKINYAPYSKKKYKFKDYEFGKGTGYSLSSFYSFTGGSLHRSHFHWRSSKDDQVKITEARSSSNLSKKRMNANIEGGPLGLLSKDKVKFRASFLDKKKMNKYSYSLKQDVDDNGEWFYIIYFKTTTKVEDLDALKSKDEKNKKQWRLANRNKLLEGKIHIDEKSLAITYFECRVPTEFKKYFCGYKEMEIKHFAYEVKAHYKKIGNIYYVDRIRQEDEFIYEDTIQNTITPYSAVQEITITDIQTKSVNAFKKSENFANIQINQLYDYPTSYNDSFWVDFKAKNPQFDIPKEIRKYMEVDKALETQFKDKHIRNENLKPPIAKKESFITKTHGDVLVDNYAWLKDTKKVIHNTEVMDYVNAENDYATNHFIPLRDMQRKIFQQLMNRTEKNYESLPTKNNGYLYHYSYTAEQEYPIYFRTKIGTEKKEILLDVNKMVEKKEGYYSAGSITMSPNNNLMAYYENTTGSDSYVIKIKNLITQKMLNDSLENIGNIIWVDDKTILYTLQEKKTYRSHKVMRHVLGTIQKNDKLLFEEKDVQFGIGLRKSHSKEYVFMTSTSSQTSEVYFLKVAKANKPFQLIQLREANHLYSVSHYEGDFHITSNKNALDYKLMRTSRDNYSIENWKEIIPHKKNVLLNDFAIFDNYLVLSEKENAQPRLRVINQSTKKSHIVKFKEKIYHVSIASNPDKNTNILRLNFSSPETPKTVFDYNMETKELKEIKKQVVNVPHWKRQIKTKRIWATAKDGTKIPITMMYNNWSLGDEKRYGPQKMYITSYGSYGSGMDTPYSIDPYILLNKSFVYAIAHVRGGDDLGTGWYNDGKMMNKKNTFTDFIDCTEYLIEEGYASKGNIVAQGGSAGGLLMGAIANMRPDLFKLIILEVPFVDVINTMLDKNLPLTTSEYGEWGNPTIKKHYKYIKSYSPYENVKKQDYPNMLFMTGLNDTRVGYWEPAKMVAKLRDFKTDDNLILLKTELNAGHGGASGRYSYYQKLAYKYAVILDIFEKDREITKYEKE